MTTKIEPVATALEVATHNARLGNIKRALDLYLPLARTQDVETIHHSHGDDQMADRESIALAAITALAGLIDDSRTIIAISPNHWGAGKTVDQALANLKKAGGSVAKGKVILRSFPLGAYVCEDGSTCWKDEHDLHEPPYYIDRDGKRMPDTHDLKSQLV